MKWQWLARWIVIGLVLGGGRAYGQEVTCERPIDVPSRVWTFSTPEERARICQALPPPKPPKPEPTTRAAHPNLRTLGWGLIVVGAIMPIPWGTDVNVTGDSYCVKSSSAKVDIESGKCGVSSLQVKAGILTAATGVAFVFIGGRQVAIQPTIGARQKAVTATLRW